MQFNNTLGPYKGGLRFHPSVNLGILRFLAFEQVFKNPLTQLPLGGRKGGSDFNPKGKSDHEVIRFCQSFMTELSPPIATSPQVTSVWTSAISDICKANINACRNESRAVSTGKGVGYGRNVLRSEATGSGNVALYAAEKLIALGARVVTLSESDGFIQCPEGLVERRLPPSRN